MLKWIEVTGKTEEAAIAAALAQLGLDRDEVSVEILDRAKSGFLGLGGSPARIKVSYEVPEEPKEVSVTPKNQKENRQETVKQQDPEKPLPTAMDAEKSAAVHCAAGAEQISAFLTGLLKLMNVNAVPAITEIPEGGYQVVLGGEDLGALIGHRGETLNAIQQLTNHAVNRGRSKRVRVHIDAEKYRAKREESLQRLARKVADKVVKYRRSVTLEPMNAYERHVIHAALQDYPNVVTYSTGTEPNRRTVVAYSRGEHKY